MSGKGTIKLLGILAGAFMLTGCAAAATTANVTQEEEVSSAIASVHGESIPLAKAAADDAVTVEPTQSPDAHVVEITLPPATPAYMVVTSPQASSQTQPAATPEASPAATPNPTPTATPEATPSYTVEELEEYVDGYVLAATVNLRAGPGTSYEVLGEYERYDTLLVTGTCEEWYRVKLDGLRGYMLKEFVAMGDVPEPTPAYAVEELDEYVDGYVNAKTINLRAGPGTGYDVLGEYERYDTLLVTGKCEDWYRVKLDGLRGYMLKEYVTIGQVKEAEPTPAPTPTPEQSIPVVEETPTTTPSTSISQADELYLAAQVVQKEGDMESYVAVANVIYNRVHSSSFPNTIEEVLYQKNQFSTSNLKAPSTAALAAVQQIFIDGNLILPAEVMYFQAASRGTDRSGYTYYGTYGGNVFFYR